MSLASIDRQLTAVQWMLGADIALLVAVLWQQCVILGRLP